MSKKLFLFLLITSIALEQKSKAAEAAKDEKLQEQLGRSLSASSFTPSYEGFSPLLSNSTRDDFRRSNAGSSARGSSLAYSVTPSRSISSGSTSNEALQTDLINSLSADREKTSSGILAEEAEEFAELVLQFFQTQRNNPITNPNDNPTPPTETADCARFPYDPNAATVQYENYFLSSEPTVGFPQNRAMVAASANIISWSTTMSPTIGKRKQNYIDAMQLAQELTGKNLKTMTHQELNELAECLSRMRGMSNLSYSQDHRILGWIIASKLKRNQSQN